MTTPAPDAGPEVRSQSYWLASSPSTHYPRLTDDIEVDVVVVGGGIAGICTAWELTRAGRDVAMLEAGRVAAAVTGHTTAKLTAQHTLVYARLRDAFGEQVARWYAESQRDAVEHVARTAAALGIECDLERVPAVTYAESSDRVAAVRAEVEAAVDAGLPASFVTETGLPYPVAGAIRVDDQAQFHPRAYLLGLVADMTARGCRVYEATRVTALHEGDPCRVATASGRHVTARHVVVATHYPVFDRGLYFARLEPQRELVVAAVIPVADDPGGAYITPEGGTRSVRTAPYRDGQRLLIVTGEKFRPGSSGVLLRHEKLLEWTLSHFPTAEPVYRWAAQDNGTTDGVPYVGRFHPRTRNVHVATGFGGWGMSNGVMAGRLIASSIGGEHLPWAGIYDPLRLGPRDAVPTAKLQATVAAHFIGDRLRSPDADAIDKIPRGGGAVVRIGAHLRAVHRDDDGRLHAVAARCTHLGCIVGFDDAEQSWDCPCHGSRFAVDGSVLQGPATRPLEQHEL